MIRRIAFLAGLSLLITLMMPRRAALNATFSPGETWEAETLTAPFDIPIYKSPEQLAADRKSLLLLMLLLSHTPMRPVPVPLKSL